MPWSFCPHCETQLDDDTHVCPACGWDPATPQPTSAAEPQQSLTERYRGTDYSTAYASTATFDRPASSGVGKVRFGIIVAFLVVLGLYGSMVAVTMFQPSGDRPAAIGVQR